MPASLRRELSACHSTGFALKGFILKLKILQSHNKAAFAALYIIVMRRFFSMLLAVMLSCVVAQAQERTVENRPYTDLRPFHFGVFVGTHLQDLELANVGPQTIVGEDGTTTEANIVADQDRWDMGFTVGVLGELRLTTHLQLRVAPALYFGTRHITFRNLGQTNAAGVPLEETQEMKTVYVSSAFEMIFSAPRFNNHRPYLLAGVTPMINLSGRDSDYIRLKRYDGFVQIGVGCDFYLPFFKLRPELKFMYSLTNSLDTDHPRRLRDANMRAYASSVREARSKIIALTFYFE